jgi:hypothetical protein
MTFRIEAGFSLVPVPGGFRLSDGPGANNWGVIAKTFRTADLAADYARACDDFKCGRTMTVRTTPTGFEEGAR